MIKSTISSNKIKPIDNVISLTTNEKQIFYKNDIKIVISPKKSKSPSKIFTRLIKRDSDSSVLVRTSSKDNLESQFASLSVSQIHPITRSPSKDDDLFDYMSSSSISFMSNVCDTDSEEESHSSPRERDPFTEKYQMGPLLGEGATCKVFKVTELKTGLKFAAKVLPTLKIFRKDFKIISKEIGIVKCLDHQNIIKLHDVLITAENVYIILEYVSGYELFDEIVSRRTFPETEARALIKQILNALSYLHQMNIAHRDLKPENLKFQSSDSSTLKLLDFGFARFLSTTSSNSILQPVGTLGYEAPEILLNEAQDTSVDMWSLGVISYILLCGYPPFFSCEEYKLDAQLIENSPFWILFNDDTPFLRNSILSENYDFKSQHWDLISNEAKDFVKNLLKVNPKERLTTETALNHSWFKSN